MFNLCCTAPVWLQASLNHFLRRRCWPCACSCVLGTRPELQERGAVTAVTKTRSCTVIVAGEAQCSSPVSELLSGTLNYANESQVCFLGQVESYAGDNSCVHRVWDKEKTMECLCGDLSTTRSMKWVRVLLGHFTSFSLYQAHHHQALVILLSVLLPRSCLLVFTLPLPASKGVNLCKSLMWHRAC